MQAKRATQLFCFLLLCAITDLSQAQLFPQLESSILCKEPDLPERIFLQYGDHTQDCRINTATDLDQFFFTGVAGETIRILVDATADRMDPVLELRDSDNNSITLEPTSCTQNCSFQTVTVLEKTDTYRLIISDIGTNETGSYRLQLERLFPAFKAPQIFYDSAVIDRISQATDMDFLHFVGEAGTEIRFNVDATADRMDPRLELRDPAGNPVTLDSAGCNQNCSFQTSLILPTSGNYLLAIRDGGNNEGGRYQISLQCLFGSCPIDAIIPPEPSKDIIVSPVDGLTTTEAGGTAKFNVVLTLKPDAAVTIALRSSNINEGTISTDSLTFTTENWNQAQTVTITGVDDNDVVDGNAMYSIITQPSESADLDYAGIDPVDVQVVNIDADQSPPDIFVSNISGPTSEDGLTASFSVVLSDQPNSQVSIDLSSSDTTEGTISPAILIFSTSNWNQAQIVTMTGRNDNEVDGDASYLAITEPAISTDPNYNGRNPADVEIINLDNERVEANIFNDNFEN